MSKERHLTVGKCANGNRFYPFLRLTGNWLKEAGFNTGNFVKVVVEENKLVILPDTGRYKINLDRQIKLAEKNLSILKDGREKYG